MKKILILTAGAALLTLGGCSEPAANSGDETDASVVEDDNDAPEPVAADDAPAPAADHDESVPHDH